MSPTPAQTTKPDFTNLKDALSDTKKANINDGDTLVTTLLSTLKDKEQSGTERSLKAKLANWPSPVQGYIKDRMVAYVNDSKPSYNPSDDDLQFINTFLNTALQDTDYKDASAYPDAQWAESIRALAYQLRNYYGVEDTDDPLPCWWR
jgi:hypothetical protein